MTTAKVDIKIGALSFAGEGDKEWLSKQLDKLIQHAPALLQITPQQEGGGGGGNDHQLPGNGNAGTLAAFLTARNAKAKDVKKFLGAAAWLHAKGTKRLTPAQVTKALDENSQGKVANPALVLKRLVAKGHCERSGNEFYVTDEGLGSLK